MKRSAEKLNCISLSNTVRSTGGNLVFIARLSDLEKISSDSKWHQFK